MEKKDRYTFSLEFRLESTNLVIEQHYSVRGSVCYGIAVRVVVCNLLRTCSDVFSY